MEMAWPVLSAFAAYLLGSLPFGYILSLLVKKTDIRRYGSGNIGATNVMRLMGPWAGALTLILDAAKGTAAVLLARLTTGQVLWELVAALLVLLGHSFPVFLNFRGGKGVATGLGVLIPLLGWIALVPLALWIIVVTVARFVSLASIIAAIAVPLTMWAFGYIPLYIWFGIAMAVFVTLRHRANIERLIKGVEPKFGQGGHGRGE